MDRTPATATDSSCARVALSAHAAAPLATHDQIRLDLHLANQLERRLAADGDVHRRHPGRARLGRAVDQLDLRLLLLWKDRRGELAAL